MNAFVEKLVWVLLEESPLLSRNRHFHTFDNPEGRYALRLARRLKSIRQSLRDCQKARGTVEIVRGELIELKIHCPPTHRSSTLTEAEFKLFLEFDGVKEALGPSLLKEFGRSLA
jgi:hypothetical protein